MLSILLKAKIHRATVTSANLHYEGSLTIDGDLMRAAGMVPFEQVKVYNINNGQRFDTYAIEGDPGSGVIGLNGAAARKGVQGDLIIIACYGLFSVDEAREYHPRILLLDSRNRIKKKLEK